MKNDQQINKHASKIPEWFHENTSPRKIVEYSAKAAKALEKRGSVDGIAQELLQSPYDWYWVPKIKDEDSIRAWMWRIWLEDTEGSFKLLRLLSSSIVYTINYMTKKWYYIPQKIRNWPNASMPWLIKYFRELWSFKQEKDIEAASIFLKFLRATYQTFTLKKQDWKAVFDLDTEEILYKDVQFIGKIRGVFNGEGFFYKKPNNTQFSDTSNTAAWMMNKSGKPVPFIARFRSKTIESQICKWVSQYSYDTIEALKDRNAMRIEVRSIEDIPHVILMILESGLIPDISRIRLEQKWQIFPQWSEIWNYFCKIYLDDKANVIKDIFAHVPIEKIKENTIPDREEVKLVANNPSFELQIVLVWNTNNTWWKADPFFKMKEDIDEEIRVNQWYIHKKRVLEHIERWIPKLKLYDINLDDPRIIFERFLKIDKKLIPLYETSEIREKTWPTHAEFFTNKDFIWRALRIRKGGIPWSFWSYEAESWICLNILKPRQIPSSPSTHETSVLLPSPDQ